ncbi:hypothetical protein BD408DRAFT_409770 [Parasitella parasitica]|nr:hypothetical protein BD408DRAFT_409702 [Parasitella parasitica]KAI8646814.1 hypothetical protein BD408DRAFT_409770 [Parasitella parasitica]
MPPGKSLPSFPCSFFRLADRTRAVDLPLNPIMFEKCEHKVTRMVGQSLSPDVCVGQTLLALFQGLALQGSRLQVTRLDLYTCIAGPLVTFL